MTSTISGSSVKIVTKIFTEMIGLQNQGAKSEGPEFTSYCNKVVRLTVKSLIQGAPVWAIKLLITQM